MYDFSNTVSIVTGGTRGIGRETSILLQKYGSKIIATYKGNRESADKFKKENYDILLFEGDLSEQGKACELIDFAYKRFEKVNFLVNAAGIWKPLSAGDFHTNEWDSMIKNNLRSVYLVTDYLIKHWLKAKQNGRIVNIASTAGIRGECGYSHYAASKGAIIAYTKSLCSELSPKGIIANCIAPGWVETEMTISAIKDDGRKKITDTIPLGRIPKPVEVAYPILFLLSEQASAITGEVLNVNGGSVLCG